MKIIASLLLAVSFGAHATGSAQDVCSNLAEVGKSAAYANSKGIWESEALSAWQNSSYPDGGSSAGKDKHADAVFTMGVIEIRAVYRKKIVDEGDGYWTAYEACMSALR